MFEKYNDITRDRAAELLCCDIKTPSVELQAQSAFRNRSRGGKNIDGYAAAEAAIRAQQLRFGAVVRDWIAANPGLMVDLEALLSE